MRNVLIGLIVVVVLLIVFRETAFVLALRGTGEAFGSFIAAIFGLVGAIFGFIGRMLGIGR